MNCRVADRALLVLDLRLIVKARSLRRQFFLDAGMAFHAELANAGTLEHLWIARTMRRVACRAAFCLDGAVFENERALLVRVALYAVGVGTDPKFGLLRFETTVSIVTVAALHRALGHFVVKRFIELALYLVVAAYAELLLTSTKHRLGPLRIHCLMSSRSDECHRSGAGFLGWFAVCTVALRAADIITPVLAAAEIIMGLLAGVTSETRIRNLLRI